jgi:hypothetical protein
MSLYGAGIGRISQGVGKCLPPNAKKKEWPLHSICTTIAVSSFCFLLAYIGIDRRLERLIQNCNEFLSNEIRCDFYFVFLGFLDFLSETFILSEKKNMLIYNI